MNAAPNQTASETDPKPPGLFGGLIVGMNALGSMWILLLVLLVTADAMGRSFFAHPIAGVTEMIQISIVGIVFSQLPDALRRGKLTRADSLLGMVRLHRPAMADVMEAAFLLLGAVYMGLALWGSIPLLTEAIERNSYLGNEGVFTVVVWPVKAVTVIGLAVCLVEFLRQSLRALRRARAR